MFMKTTRIMAVATLIATTTWEYTVQGKPPATLKAGDVLFIPAGTIHSARNVGTGRAAELATYIVEKGKPLITVVE
jgi:gentisate 1,2-dioxygenase